MAKIQPPASYESMYKSYADRKKNNTEGQGHSRGTTEKEHRHESTLRTHRWAMARENLAPIGSTEYVDRFMQFWVNPSECTWSVGTRSAFDRTSGGIVHHEIPIPTKNGHRTTRFDLPSVVIAFQSGIITPDGYNHIGPRGNDSLSPLMGHGLGNFYDFLDLLDRQNVMDNGLPNYVNIYYVSAVFGYKGIWLQGFFDDSGTSWTETAEQPNTITSWTSTFTVFKSFPPLHKLRQNYIAPKVKGVGADTAATKFNRQVDAFKRKLNIPVT